MSNRGTTNGFVNKSCEDWQICQIKNHDWDGDAKKHELRENVSL